MLFLNTIAIEDALKEISVLLDSHTGYQHTSKGNRRQQEFFVRTNMRLIQ